jgi:hypothetical protein
LLRLVVQHQDRPKIIRLRGKFIPIDPRGWNADMDMIVNVALGRGSDEQRMAFLAQIAARQEAIIQQYGPMNPLVDVMQYRNTLAQIIQLSGFADPSQFVKEISPETLQQYMQSMQKPPQPDPAQILAQVEVEKIKSDMMIAAAKQELERQKAVSDADLQRDKLAVDAMLRAQEMQAKYGAQVDIAALNAEVNRQRAEIKEQFGLQRQMMTPQPGVVQ